MYESQKKFFKENRELIYKRNKWYRLKYRYGMSREEYDLLADRQNYLCAICGEAKKLCVDHHHETGKVRGLLCQDCNKGLGFFSDKEEYLTKAVSHLRS